MSSTQDLQNQRIIDVAMTHFKVGEFEYGRPDQGYTKAQQEGNRDIYRDERDGSDGDQKKGVDCSALVWRALQNSGFNLNKSVNEFSTSTLFNGSQLTPYAKDHFEYLPPSSKMDHSLKPGDLIMLKMPSGSQHIAIFKEYDDKGRIHFFGSQSSTGPAEVVMSGNKYWDHDSIYYGALRPKENFIKPEHKIQSEPDNRLPQTSMPSQHTDAGLTVKDLSERHQTLVTHSHEHVHRLYKEHGLPIDQGTQNTILSLAVAASERGMNRIDHAVVKEGNINVAQINGMVAHTTSINGHVAANTPVEQSLHKLAELEQSQVQQMRQPSQQLEQPQLSRSMV